MKNKKTILIVVFSLVALAIAGVLGWGFYNGYQISSYTENAQAMMNESSDWEDTYYETETADFEEAINSLSEIEKEANENLSELNSAAVPSKAEDLHGYLVEYYTEAASVANKSKTEIEKMKEEYGSFEDFEKMMEDGLDEIGLDESEEAIGEMTLNELEEKYNELDDELDGFSEEYLSEAMKIYDEIDRSIQKMEDLEKKIELEIITLKDTLFSLN